MTHLRRPLLLLGAVTTALLLLPAIAMQFTAEVSWGPGDFLAAGALLFGTGALAVIGFRRFQRTGSRMALTIGLALGLALIWAELAVGVLPG